MGVDRQYSTDFVKTEGPKLFPLSRFYYPNSRHAVVIAGAGNPDSTKKAVGLINAELPDKFTFEEFYRCTEQVLTNVYSSYIDVAPQADQESLHFNLLIGVRIGLQHQLFRSNRNMLIHESGPTCIGMGLYLGNYLLDSLLSIKPPSVAIAEQVVTHIISAATDYIESVGRGTYIYVIKGREHYPLFEDQRDKIESSLKSFFGGMNLVHFASDIELVSDEGIDFYLDELRKRLLALRQFQRDRKAFMPELIKQIERMEEAEAAVQAMIPKE